MPARAAFALYDLKQLDTAWAKIDGRNFSLSVSFITNHH